MISTDAKYHPERHIRRVKLTDLPYLTLSDVEKIYRVLNDWNTKDLEQFAQKAREIAIKVPSKKTEYAYQFVDEKALFKLFQAKLPLQLERKSITNWGQLMQYIS